MDLQDLLSQLYQSGGDNLKDSNDEIKAAMKAQLQRIASGNMSGSSPEEDKYYKDMTNAVAGSVAPVSAEGEVAEGIIPKLKQKLSQQDNRIGVSNNVQDLTGKGQEILTDKLDNPIAEFIDGNFKENPVGVSRTEVTAPSSENLPKLQNYMNGNDRSLMNAAADAAQSGSVPVTMSDLAATVSQNSRTMDNRARFAQQLANMRKRAR